MTSQLAGAIIFLIGALSSLYLLALAIRLILAYEHANYFNPITRFIITITQPVIGPLRRLIPNVGRFETSTFFLIIVLEIAVVSMVVMIDKGVTPPPQTLFAITIFSTLSLFLNIFFWTIIISVILSWFQVNHPIVVVLKQLAEPALRPFRRLIPLISGIDISPIFALILIQFLLRLIPVLPI